MSLRPRVITIIGLGLIGGSLAAACRKKFPHAKIIGISRRLESINKARRKNWIHKGFQDLKEAMLYVEKRGLDTPNHLIVLCVPVDNLKGYLLKLDRLAPSGTVVTDTGSVKGFIVDWADRRNWRRIRYVGAHPMAGSHERGIDAAEPNLFDVSLTFVTRSRKDSPRALRFVKNFWSKISHRVVVVTPDEHDNLAAQVSHLPHLVAALLVSNVSSKALSFAASGFRDTTRVAQGDPSLWVPVLLENRRQLSWVLQDLERKIKRAEEVLKKRDFRRLAEILRLAKRRRAALSDPMEELL